MIILSLKILFKESKKYYELLKIPEFDVHQIKDVIALALVEFKKNLPECNLAFDKLVQSLDTFVENFGGYYENFQLEGRNPGSLLFGFIDDVQKQYTGSDNKEYRTLLRQFKKIQQEFGKKLSTNLQNPILKDLYKHLEGQINKA